MKRPSSKKGYVYNHSAKIHNLLIRAIFCQMNINISQNNGQTINNLLLTLRNNLLNNIIKEFLQMISMFKAEMLITF